jgi:predicted metal-binding membrane protein
MSVDTKALPPGVLERVLARDRLLIAVVLAVLVVLAWAYLFALSRQMGGSSMAEMASMPAMPTMPDMPGMSGMADGAGAAAGQSTARSLTVAALMWWTMMFGMMVPSAAPVILLFGNVQRRQLAAESPQLRVALFTAGYLATWGLFSVFAAGTQLVLTRLTLLAPVELTATTWLGAALVGLAGVYQLTPLKNVCLRRCRAPAEFLSSHWRPHTAGAFRMGVDHGVYCVGCCWLLMGLLFVVGVMNLAWVAAIAAFVIVEKLLPYGPTTAKISGFALLLLAVYLGVNA